MRHSGFDASELTQGFGIEPYVVYSPPMVASVGMIPRLVVAALMLVNLSP